MSKGIFLSPRMIDVILSINNGSPKYASKIARSIGAQYSLVNNYLSLLEEKGIIGRGHQKNKREKYITLTKKGKQLFTHLKKVKEIWDGK